MVVGAKLLLRLLLQIPCVFGHTIILAKTLLINVRNGGIYYWDKTGGFNTRAVSLDSLAGSTKAPTIAKQIMVSDRDRHIIAFGCDPEA